MTVLPEGGDCYTVVGENGGTYGVDARDGRCTCPDYQHRDAHCKHLRRVAFATGSAPVPAGIDADPHLGAHVEGEPVRAATDGGEDETPRSECWCADTDLPCFEHFIAER